MKFFYLIWSFCLYLTDRFVLENGLVAILLLISDDMDGMCFLEVRFGSFDLVDDFVLVVNVVEYGSMCQDWTVCYIYRCELSILSRVHRYGLDKSCLEINRFVMTRMPNGKRFRVVFYQYFNYLHVR